MKRQKTRIIFDVEVQRKWKVIYSYPDSLLLKFESLKEGLNIYANEGFSKALFEKCHFNHRFWKSLYYQISKNQTLEVSFRKAKGIRGDIGLEWCKHKIKSYYVKYKTIPSYSRVLLFKAMKYACLKGVFSEYSILNWDDLLKSALPDVEIRSLKGLEGLKRAEKFLVDYYSKEGNIPTLSHTSFNLIASAIKKKYWIDYNIEYWKDLLFYIFGKSMIPGYSRGSMGFNKAREELSSFFEKNGCIPWYDDFACMQGVIRRGYWHKFDIKSWSDMLKCAFGIENQPSITERKEFLQVIQKKLTKYYEETKILPTSIKFRFFEYLISVKKFWVKYGISTWNDLLMELFGRVNTEGISSKLIINKKA